MQAGKNADSFTGELMMLYIELQTTLISVMSVAIYAMIATILLHVLPVRKVIEIFQEKMPGEDITYYWFHFRTETLGSVSVKHSLTAMRCKIGTSPLWENRMFHSNEDNHRSCTP